jgi:hypothetical protein
LHDRTYAKNKDVILRQAKLQLQIVKHLAGRRIDGRVTILSRISEIDRAFRQRI